MIIRTAFLLFYLYLLCHYCSPKDEAAAYLLGSLHLDCGAIGKGRIQLVSTTQPDAWCHGYDRHFCVGPTVWFLYIIRKVFRRMVKTQSLRHGLLQWFKRTIGYVPIHFWWILLSGNGSRFFEQFRGHSDRIQSREAKGGYDKGVRIPETWSNNRSK